MRHRMVESGGTNRQDAKSAKVGHDSFAFLASSRFNVFAVLSFLVPPGLFVNLCRQREDPPISTVPPPRLRVS